MQSRIKKVISFDEDHLPKFINNVGEQNKTKCSKLMMIYSKNDEFI